MTNLYHIIDKEPALNAEDLPVQLEDLVRRLVSSGLVRIDAYHQINFARFIIPSSGASTMFSKRQLNDPNLLPLTKLMIGNALASNVPAAELNKKINSTINSLKAEIHKYIPIDEEMELKLARIIVQTSHPVVIELVMLENVQVFISYSHNIGDVLDIPTWQQAGTNSGMQSTDGKQTAIYVSCGGDPLFFEKKDKKEELKGAPQDEITYGSGRPSLARALVIGGQEFGHYSDIVRDQYGRYIARHSAALSGRRPTEIARIGRLADIDNVDMIRNSLVKLGLFKVLEYERHVKFYRKNRLNNLRAKFTKFITNYHRNRFLGKVKSTYLAILVKKFSNYQYPVSSIFDMIEDMDFNLAPEADVYKNPDKNVEEAIACIEALARVPQQCNKWGAEITKFIYPNLYKLYYDQVIPSCIHDYENFTKRKFELYPQNLKLLPYYIRASIKLKRRLKNYFNNKFRKK